MKMLRRQPKKQILKTLLQHFFICKYRFATVVEGVQGLVEHRFSEGDTLLLFHEFHPPIAFYSTSFLPFL
jgi:hypothetical protein